MSYQQNQYKENLIAIVDSNFFEIFTIPFISGNEKTALAEPNNIVITKEFAKKYFGSNDPVGKQLNYSVFQNDLKVTGVIESVPDNSHFHFDAFISRRTIPNVKDSGWINVGTFTYLKLDKNVDANKLQSKFPQIVAEHAVSEIQKNRGVTLDKAQQSVNTMVFKLRPVRDIHLYSKTKYELEPPGDIQYVYIFGALAVFILLLACVNFVNLATASAATRSKEVGIRKVMGSLKNQLVFQFLVESVLVSFCALVISLILVYSSLPWYNQLSGEHIDFSSFINPPAILGMAGFTLLTGLIAGIYPAFFMSSFQTIKVLKGLQGTQFQGKSLLRNGLVVFQFSISLILIVATLVVYNQLHYMQNRKLGYNKDQVVIVSNAYLLKQNQDPFKQQLLQNRHITGVSNAFGFPADTKMGGTQASPMETKDNENHSDIHVNIYHVDYDYIPVLQMEMATGRNFSRDFPSDSIDGVIINQAAARDLGWNDSSAIGRKIIRSGQKTLNVVGVVKDFQYASARQFIAPLIMLLRKGNSYLVRINAADIKAVISDIQHTWNSFSTGASFEYTFLDDNFNNQYRSEEITGKTFSIFSVIAIFIAGMGLIGLISYITVSRTREIGVRKVLGASVHGIVFMLAKTFIKLIMISVFIAAPLSWWLMNKWLEDFAYKTNISWRVFAEAGSMALLIALFTISFQAIKAGIANPVKSLRAE
jgi:putative ABC transport system permease protein